MNRNSRRSLGGTLTTVALLSLFGCVSTGKNFDDSKIYQIKKGQTNEADLIQMFGTPYSRLVNSEGITTLTWLYHEMKIKGQTFIPIVGPFLGGAETKNKVLIVTLEPDGKVKHFESSGGDSEIRHRTLDLPQ